MLMSKRLLRTANSKGINIACTFRDDIIYLVILPQNLGLIVKNQKAKSTTKGQKRKACIEIHII